MKPLYTPIQPNDVRSVAPGPLKNSLSAVVSNAFDLAQRTPATSMGGVFALYRMRLAKYTLIWVYVGVSVGRRV